MKKKNNLEKAFFSLIEMDYICYHVHSVTLKTTLFSTVNWRRQWQPTPVFLPGKSHGWRSLVGCSPWGREESDATELFHFQFSLSCIWEGNGNPLQCSCLENPRDGGAWWATFYGVAQSRTGLKRLSSSKNSKLSLPRKQNNWVNNTNTKKTFYVIQLIIFGIILQNSVITQSTYFFT